MLELMEGFSSPAVSSDELMTRIEAAKQAFKGEDVLGEVLKQFALAGVQLFEVLLKDSNTEDNFLKLQYLFQSMPGQFPYRRELVKLVSNTPAEQGLSNLIRLYGTNLRDPQMSTDYEHIVQTMIRLEWVDGLAYLLQKNPSLVNIAALKIKNGEVENAYPLLVFCLKNNYHNADILSLILTDDLNLLLKDKSGNTVFHFIASERDIENDQIMEWIVNHANKEYFSIKNDDGKTPLDLENIHGKIVPENVFFSEENHNKRLLRLFHVFKNKVPSLTPDILYAALAGKILAREEKLDTFNARLFLNIESFIEFLTKKSMAINLPLIVNAIVIINGGHHAVNIYCCIKDKKNINAIIIDGLGDGNDQFNDCYKVQVKLKEVGIDWKTLSLVNAILNSEAACYVLVSYLAGKFSNIAVKEAQQLFDTLAARAKNGLLLAKDFPLWLGILTICESMAVHR